MFSHSLQLKATKRRAPRQYRASVISSTTYRACRASLRPRYLTPTTDDASNSSVRLARHIYQGSFDTSTSCQTILVCLIYDIITSHMTLLYDTLLSDATYTTITFDYYHLVLLTFVRRTLYFIVTYLFYCMYASYFLLTPTPCRGRPTKIGDIYVRGTPRK